MQATWRVYVVSAVLSCAVAAATALVTVRIAGPAKGTDAGGSPSGPASREVVLEGVAKVPCAGEKPSELDVFYKTPFASPPYLTFPDGLTESCTVADQKATSFKLRRTATAGTAYVEVKWHAEGQPAK
jgi:hypothetical protein